MQSFNDVVEAYGPSNTILDNCHILTAFASADTATCQRISQMTGTVTEYRESYSQPHRHWFGPRTVNQSEQVRPLLTPGDIRELPADDQLVFVTGYPPMRTRKLRYYADSHLRKRLLPPPDPSVGRDVLTAPTHDWRGERPKGAQRPLPVAELLARGQGRALDRDEPAEQSVTEESDADAEDGPWPDGEVTDI